MVPWEAPALEEAVQLAQLTRAQRTEQVRGAVVQPQIMNLVVPGVGKTSLIECVGALHEIRGLPDHAVIAESPQVLGHCVIVRRDGAGVPVRAQIFPGIKTETTCYSCKSCPTTI